MTNPAGVDLALAEPEMLKVTARPLLKAPEVDFTFLHTGSIRLKSNVHRLRRMINLRRFGFSRIRSINGYSQPLLKAPEVDFSFSSERQNIRLKSNVHRLRRMINLRRFGLSRIRSINGYSQPSIKSA